MSESKFKFLRKFFLSVPFKKENGDMKKEPIINQMTRGFLIGILSGVGTILTFPNFHFTYLVFFSFVPLFLYIQKHSLTQALFATTIFVVTLYLYILSWIRVFHPVALPGLVIAISIFHVLTVIVYRAIQSKNKRSISQPILLALCFTSLEYLRTFGFIRFPYGSIAYTQYDFLTLIQITEVTGYLGISFLIYFTNALIAQLIGNFSYFSNKILPKRRAIHLRTLLFNRFVFLLFLFTAILGYGNARINTINKIISMPNELSQGKSKSINPQEIVEKSDKQKKQQDDAKRDVYNEYYNSERYSYKPLRVSLIQPWFDYNLPWTKENKDLLYNKLVKLTDQVKDENSSLIIWPETAILDYYEYRLENGSNTYSHQFKDFFESFAETNQNRFLVGSLAVGYPTEEDFPQAEKESTQEAKEDQQSNNDGNSKSAKDAKTTSNIKKKVYKYNASLFLEADGEIIDFSGKKLLVGFAEYFPYEDLLRKIGWLQKMLNEAQASSFTPYPNYKVFFDERAVPFGSLICYEDCFPDPSVSMTLSGAKFLVLITNDAWSYSVKSQVLHYSFSIFRAIENRRPILRVGNAGITGLVNATGELSHDIPQFEEGVTTFSFKPLTLLSAYGMIGANIVHIILLFFIFLYIPYRMFGNSLFLLIKKGVKKLFRMILTSIKKFKKTKLNEGE